MAGTRLVVACSSPMRARSIVRRPLALGQGRALAKQMLCRVGACWDLLGSGCTQPDRTPLRAFQKVGPTRLRP